MPLRKLKFKPYYNSKSDDLLEGFYIPALSNCTNYKRVSAYFDSGILELYSTGIENIVVSNGHISFIFSSELSEKDFELMKKGYKNRAEIERRLSDAISTDCNSVNLSNLAYLIAHNYVDIKIAFTKRGIVHDKFGLIEEGNDILYFRGSNNETVASILNNFESFETSNNWDAEQNELIKIQNAENEFNALWNDRYSGVIVMPIPDVVKEKLISYDKGKLILTTENLDNTFVFDCNDKRELIGFNKLTNPQLLYPPVLFYNQYIISYLKEQPKTVNSPYLFDTNLSYIQIKKVIQLFYKQGQKKGFNIYVTPRLTKYLSDCDIQAEKRRSLGIAIKNKNSLVIKEFHKFSKIVNKYIVRPLREPQLWGAFHIVQMLRSANFSVPGAGKTSIVYGAFAYLLHMGYIDKIVMVGPINSFSAWKNEFKENFGRNVKLKCFDYQQNVYRGSGDRFDKIVYNSQTSNLVLINYESLQNNTDALINIINERTLLVFDEVHRIKSIVGKRAAAALSICKKAKYRVVLTGTPIPNGYIDIYNFLNILFPDEYNVLFNYDFSYLKEANTHPDQASNINYSLAPFFCRTTKKDLNVPPPEPDDLETYIKFDDSYEEILKLIYRECSDNIFLLYIRLIQASANPSLILKKLEFDDFKMLDGEGEELGFFEKMFQQSKKSESYSQKEKELIKSYGMTEKYHKAINLACELSKNNEQSIMWCVFIDTIKKVRDSLAAKGVSCRVIYGNTPLEERETIIKDFINKKFKVLITNPHTLAESVSLHKNCHHAIYLEYTFNLVHMLQSRDRIHRLGLLKNDKTYYHYMIMDNPDFEFNSIDMRIYNRLKQKEILQAEAVESQNLVFVNDDMEKDIKELLS